VVSILLGDGEFDVETLTRRYKILVSISLWWVKELSCSSSKDSGVVGAADPYNIKSSQLRKIPSLARAAKPQLLIAQLRG